MKVKLEITEGCVAYSYSIDGMEYVDLTDKEDDDYNPSLVTRAMDALIEELIEQNKQDDLLVDLLIYSKSHVNLLNSQWFFEYLFHANNNVVTVDSYICDQCGDIVITEELIIDIPDNEKANAKS